MKRFEYFKPQSLAEASKLLLEIGEGALVFNGGTDLVVRMRDRITEPEAVIDIKGIKELMGITVGESYITIGGTTTLNEIASNDIIQQKYRILAEAAHSVGSKQVRNRATMTGNICNASPLADTATPLLVLDAKMLVFGPEGEKEIPIQDFFIWVRKTMLKHGEIVKGIKIPLYEDEIKGSFQKLSRRPEVDLSTVCASIIKVNNEIRIALGAVAPTPIRLKKTEEYLKGKTLTDEVIEEAKGLGVLEISPIDDIRASKEYRLEMAEVLISRGLNEIKG